MELCFFCLGLWVRVLPRCFRWHKWRKPHTQTNSRAQKQHQRGNITLLTAKYNVIYILFSPVYLAGLVEQSNWGWADGSGSATCGVDQTQNRQGSRPSENWAWQAMQWMKSGCHCRLYVIFQVEQCISSVARRNIREQSNKQIELFVWNVPGKMCEDRISKFHYKLSKQTVSTDRPIFRKTAWKNVDVVANGIQKDWKNECNNRCSTRLLVFCAADEFVWRNRLT